MSKHIGIVACSAEGAALCYRTVCTEAARIMGEYCHPEVTMHTHSFGEYMKHIEQGAWTAVADLMLSSARKLAQAGAEFAICPDNTVHQAFEMMIEASPIPWLHIAEEVAREAHRHGFRNLGILGTKYLMEGPVYPSALKDFDIASVIPEEDERTRINEIIFRELVYGVFPASSHAYMCEAIERLKVRGCDAVVLGCTELPLIVSAEESPLPPLDSTRTLARAALKRAVAEA